MKKTKKLKVIFSEEAQSKLNNLPDEVHEELEKLIKGFKDGSVDPSKVGQPLDCVELKIKLVCPECKSIKVEWLLDQNSNEITFHCFKCLESFWMTHKEYEKAVKDNLDNIIR